MLHLSLLLFQLILRLKSPASESEIIGLAFAENLLTNCQAEDLQSPVNR